MERILRRRMPADSHLRPGQHWVFDITGNQITLSAH